MKILLHCDEYWPRHTPCAIRMQVFAKVFQECRDSCTVLAGKHCLDGVSVPAKEAIYCKTVPLRKKTSLYRAVNQLSFAFSSLIKSPGAGKADFVITTSPPVLISMFGWLIAKWKGAKLVYDVRDIWPDVALEMGSFTEKSPYYRIFRFIADFMFKHADVITTVSPGKVEKIKEKLPESRRDRVWLVENGLDEAFLGQSEDSSVIERYGLDQRFTCVYIGNIGLAQGLIHLLDLAQKVDKEKFQFLLFGQGAERKMLEETAVRRGLTNVTFCGTVDGKTIYSVLKNAAMTYIPLVNSNLKDSIPTKTYEALGAGCPILMAAAGDAAEIIKECGFGMTISPDEIEKLPEVFLDFVKKHKEILSRREETREYVLQRHSRQKIALKLEADLKDFLQQGNTQ